MTRPLSLPVVVAARHVRLSQAHLEVLFGSGSALVHAVPLPPTGTFASLDVVEVRGPAGAVQRVRVVGPLLRQTEVRIGHRDLVALGMDSALVARDPAASPGCTLVGPRGTVVLAAGMRVGLRRLTLTRELAADAGLEEGDRATVHVRGDRARELRDVPVELGPAAWLSIDVDDANGIEVGPTTRATFVGS